MPHVLPSESSDTLEQESTLPSVNGQTPESSESSELPPSPISAADVLLIAVTCPDGTKRTVTLPTPFARKNIAAVVTQICRQLNIHDDMAAILPEHFWQEEDSNSDPSPVRLVYPEELNERSPENVEESRKSNEKNESDGKRYSLRKSKRTEPETVTILSSDSEDESKCEDVPSESSPPEEVKKPSSVVDKEPIITEETEGTDLSPYPALAGTLSGGGKDLNELIDSPEVENSLLECRTVRIGSYKVVPNDHVLLSAYGLRIKVHSLKQEPTTIKIFRNEIVKVLVHFGADLPVMFYYITSAAGRKVRAALHMSPKDGSLYFDPTSSEEVHKRITLLPVEICEESRLFIKSIYENNGLLGELDANEANDILVRAANKKDAPATPTTKINKPTPSQQPTSSSPSCQLIQTIMIYPPPPIKGGIAINTEDYACLGEDQFLNDVIIDFYLKYLMLNELSEEDRKRTHVLSSFFYKRLTSKTSPTGARLTEFSSPLSAAEKRHARVKGWTKGVNIFAKDFIIIPINENSHWFLAIICFPGLTGCVSMNDNRPLPDDSGRSGNHPRPRATSSADPNSGKVPDTIGETTITVISPPPVATTSISVESDGEEKDEAEGTEDDVEPNSSDDEGKDSDANGDLMDEEFPRPPKVSSASKSTPSNQEPIKQPCILVFDSLMGSSRSRVIATLREYLHIEYKVKHKGATRDFSKNCIKGTVPKVPQQNNYTDCGLYLLQYVEEFFKKPISDFRMPLKLKDWFPTEIVSTKRYDIQQLLLKLMDDQGVDRERLNLPRLDLPSEQPNPYSDDCDDEMMCHNDFEEMGEEEVEEDQEEEVMEEDDYEDDDDDEHFPVQMEKSPAVNSAVFQNLKKSTTVSLLPAASGRSEGSSPAARAEAAKLEARAEAKTEVSRAESVRSESLRPETSRTISRNKSPPPRATVKPTILMEAKATKRTVLHLNSPDAAGIIKKKPMTSPAQRSSAPPRSPLSRISSSVEITKKKVRPE